ncbi:MAG: AI-2E family transporter [Terracidiphilus sp.]
MNQSAQSKQNVHGHILFFFAVALALYVAWLIRGMLALLYISALFAVVLSPVVQATSRIHIGRWKPFHGSTAILILLLAVAGAFAVFGFFALPPVINDLQSLAGELPNRLPGILDKIKEIPYADRIDAGDVISWIQRGTSGGATYLLTSFRAWAGVLVEVLAGFVLTLYFILEGDGAYRWFLSFMPTTPRHRLDATLRRAAGRMEKWLVGQLSLMLILGTTSTIVYLLLGVRYAYVLGVLTGLLNLIPVLGAAVSLVLALLVAAIDSWGRVLGVAIFFVVYLQIENSWLIPRIMRSRVQLPALAIFLSLLLGSAICGIAGAMVAIPTAVLVSVLVEEYLVKKNDT